MTADGASAGGADYAQGGDFSAVEPEVADGPCPYLGMVGDRYAHNSFPSRLHLCHAGEPAHIGLGFQADYCLGGLYPSCARYQRAEEAAAAIETAAPATVAATEPLAPPPPPAPAPAALALAETAPVGLVAAATDAAPAIAPPLAPLPSPSSRLGRVSGMREPGGRSLLVNVLLGLALISVLAAFVLASGIIKLPKGGPVTGVVTPTPGVTATAAVPTSPAVSSTPAPTPTPSPTAPPTSTPVAGEISYTVQPGDNLTIIATKFNVPIDAIVARNGLTNPDAIVAGQVLIIPLGATAPPPTATPQPTASVPGASPTPNASGTVYIVQPGDSLSGIATKFNVTQQAILDANPTITDPNKIFVGEQIIIPAAP